MHIYHKHNVLISEQQVTDTNPLFDLAYVPRDPQHHIFLLLHSDPYTHTQNR